MTSDNEMGCPYDIRTTHIYKYIGIYIVDFTASYFLKEVSARKQTIAEGRNILCHGI